jgi:uncharacterized membrane protein
MNKLLAIEGSPIGSPFSGIGILGNPNDKGAVTLFASFISATIGLMTIIAVIWFIFVLITGAISIISAGGDKQALENAQKRITTGLIGLVVVVAGIFLVDLVGRLIGIENILNIKDLVNKLPIVGGSIK